MNSQEELLEKILGSLVGGAVGDALGYAVEFKSIEQIRRTFGENGISRYSLNYKGLAEISDDTQMTLFTANGLLYGMTKNCTLGKHDSLLDSIQSAYLDWYQTQSYFMDKKAEQHICWLRNIPELNSLRAPGTTCMGALSAIANGRTASNNSKGCGGVMRVAPMGLFAAACQAKGIKLSNIDQLGAEAARLTHKHPLGFLPAAMMTHIVYSLALREEDINANDLEVIIRDALSSLPAMVDESTRKSYSELFSTDIQYLTRLIEKAIALSSQELDDVQAIGELGEGWVGDEALAIAIYCSLKYHNNFEKAVIAAVNHSGDSDSTGAVTGNIVGTIVGRTAIPLHYTENLELISVIEEIANDLFMVCPTLDKKSADTSELECWIKKYVKYEVI